MSHEYDVTFDSSFNDFPAHDCHRLLVQILGWKTENNNFKNHENKNYIHDWNHFKPQTKIYAVDTPKIRIFGESMNHTLKRDPWISNTVYLSKLSEQ